MSAITKEQSARVGKFMTEFWNDEMKPYYNPPELGTEEDEKFWKELRQKTADMCNKHGADDIIVRQIAYAFVSGVDKVQKGKTNIELGEYMYKSDAFVDALNRMFKANAALKKAQEEVNAAMTDLQNAFKSAHKVKLADGSLQAAKVIEK